MSAESGIAIEAPAETVWRVWVDVAAWPEWSSTVTTLTRLDEGELGVGSRVRIRQPQLPAAIWEVTEWQPPTGWVWVTRHPGATTSASHHVEDLGGGRSRVTASTSHSGRLGALVRTLFGGLSRTLVDRETADLKRCCEGGPTRQRKPPPEGLRH